MIARELLTAEDAALELDLTDGRIRQLARAGILKGVKRANAWFFDREEVDRYKREKQEERKQ